MPKNCLHPTVLTQTHLATIETTLVDLMCLPSFEPFAEVSTIEKFHHKRNL